MNAIEWTVQHHVPYKRPLIGTNPTGRGGPPPIRYANAERAAKLIAKHGKAMTRTQIMAKLKMSRSTVRQLCEAGEEMGILKQSPVAMSEQGLMTYLVDVA